MSLSKVSCQSTQPEFFGFEKPRSFALSVFATTLLSSLILSSDSTLESHQITPLIGYTAVILTSLFTCVFFIEKALQPRDTQVKSSAAGPKKAEQIPSSPVNFETPKRPTVEKPLSMEELESFDFKSKDMRRLFDKIAAVLSVDSVQTYNSRVDLIRWSVNRLTKESQHRLFSLRTSDGKSLLCLSILHASHELALFFLDKQGPVSLEETAEMLVLIIKNSLIPLIKPLITKCLEHPGASKEGLKEALTTLSQGCPDPVKKAILSSFNPPSKSKSR